MPDIINQSGAPRTPKPLGGIIAAIIIIAVAIGFIVYFAMPKQQPSGSMSEDKMTENTPNEAMENEPNANAMMEDKTKTGTMSETGVKEFTVNGANFSFDPKEIKVKKGDKVKITLKNLEGFHDLVIDELNVKTPRINTGEETSVTFTADKTGTFVYYCSVGEHRAMGMWGNLIVE